MAESAIKKGRVRDAGKTRETILDAAETVFAEHGFDGARIDAIVKVSGYNTSLLFQYYGDKVGLYSAVLERFHKELNALSEQVLAPWLSDTANTFDRQGLELFLTTLVQTIFDYLIDHPRFLRILTWEMAEGWQTYQQIASKFMADETNQLEARFDQARREGWLRSDFALGIQLTLAFQICQSYLAFLPMYQMQLPTADLSSHAALIEARDRLATWIVGAMLVDSPDTKDVTSSEKSKP